MLGAVAKRIKAWVRDELPSSAMLAVLAVHLLAGLALFYSLSHTYGNRARDVAVGVLNESFLQLADELTKVDDQSTEQLQIVLLRFNLLRNNSGVLTMLAWCRPTVKSYVRCARTRSGPPIGKPGG